MKKVKSSKVFYNTQRVPSRDKKKKAKEASPKVGNANKNKDSHNSNGKHCSKCAKHGGPHKTHGTADCFK